MLTLVKKERIIFMAVFIITATMVLLDRMTPVVITSAVLSFILLAIACSMLMLMVCQYLFGELPLRFIWLIVGIVFFACFGMTVLTAKTAWKTQTIMFTNTDHPKETIEYRMRAKTSGSGYERGIVRRKPLLPFIDFVTDVDTAAIDRSKWIKVDKEINEMGFPGEYVDTKRP